MLAALADTPGLRRLAATLQTASTHLTGTCSELDAQVSGLLWTQWQGPAATAFQSHWKTEQSSMLWLARDSAGMAAILLTLAQELDAANAMAANPQMFAAALAFARVAWAQATAELSAITVTEVTDPTFARRMRDLGQGIAGIATGLIDTMKLSLRLSVPRAMFDPLGFARDLEATGTAVREEAQKPGAFKNFLGSIIDLEDWQNGHPFRALPATVLAVAPVGGEARLATAAGTKVAVRLARVEAAGLRRLAVDSPEAAENLRTFYQSQPDSVLKALKARDPMAASVYDERIPPNTDLARILEDNKRYAPHDATFTYRSPDEKLTSWGGLQSGNMTEAESALPFPKNMQATHTEIRALSASPLEPGGELSIVGQYNPCDACVRAMEDASKSGATVRYSWPGGEFTAENGVGSLVFR